jgi:hypothetical protein
MEDRMNFIRASNSVVRAIRRRLAQAVPPQQLVEDSVKRLALPGTHYHVTTFIFEVNGKRVFVAELAEQDVPHIYQSAKLPEPASKWLGGAKKDAREFSKIMLTCIRDLAVTVQKDPRFNRSNVIVLNGHALNHSIAQIEKSKNKL